MALLTSSVSDNRRLRGLPGHNLLLPIPSARGDAADCSSALATATSTAVTALCTSVATAAVAVAILAAATGAAPISKTTPGDVAPSVLAGRAADALGGDSRRRHLSGCPIVRGPAVGGARAKRTSAGLVRR